MCDYLASCNFHLIIQDVRYVHTCRLLPHSSICKAYTSVGRRVPGYTCGSLLFFSYLMYVWVMCVVMCACVQYVCVYQTTYYITKPHTACITSHSHKLTPHTLTNVHTKCVCVVRGLLFLLHNLS